ncbi:hypothetical protein [Streptosporangium saharense]
MRRLLKRESMVVWEDSGNRRPIAEALGVLSASTTDWRRRATYGG